MDSYYSKKLMHRVQRNPNDPFYSEQLFHKLTNGSVPKILNEPTLEQYGIPTNYQEVIDNHNKKIKKLKRISFWVSLVIFNFFFTKVFYAKLFNRFDIEVYLYGFFVTAWFYPVLIEIFGLDDIAFRKVQRFEIQEKVNKYRFDYQSFKYWQYMKQRNNWESMDGRQFEYAVASIYRNQGFNVNVSRQGGDGGVDIVLTKGNEKIAVQCKAHKTAVAPSVIRDLYGTMGHYGYSRGILVSLNGFTKGVYEFAKDKRIELIEVEDLISMSR